MSKRLPVYVYDGANFQDRLVHAGLRWERAERGIMSGEDEAERQRTTAMFSSERELSRYTPKARSQFTK